MPEVTVDVPAIGLLGLDRITAIREGDGDQEDVDWVVTHPRDQMCPEHGVKHMTIAYETRDGDEKVTAEHCFERPDTWLTVQRSHADRIADGPMADAPVFAEAS